MQVIVSHDVDHISLYEHNADFILPKFFIRSFIEWYHGGISWVELRKRWHDLIVTNKWQNISELMNFDRSHNIPSTFFLAVNQGKNLAYTVSQITPWIQELTQKGFEVGVHGICYNRLAGIKDEYERFLRLSERNDLGIRMHYLRTNKYTLGWLAECGYSYDTSIYEIAKPFRVGKMIEFPLHLMESSVLIPYSQFKTAPLREAKKLTLQRIEKVCALQLPYLTLLFHDWYFSDRFTIWKDWYIWVIEYLKQNGFKFTNYIQAVKDLETKI